MWTLLTLLAAILSNSARLSPFAASTAQGGKNWCFLTEAMAISTSGPSQVGTSGLRPTTASPHMVLVQTIPASSLAGKHPIFPLPFT